MQSQLTKADILAFQDDIAARFERGEIRHPIHLCDPSQLDHLLPIFEQIQPQDWLFTSYRGIYHWLLKGVPPEELREAIMRQGTMGFCDAQRRIVSSAIVAGQVPIALGVALGLRRLGYRSNDNSRVWCFLGDMAAETGGFYEASKYAWQHKLPVAWVLEDNGLSTNTPTQTVWGAKRESIDVRAFAYQRTVSHVGIGKWVTFS